LLSGWKTLAARFVRQAGLSSAAWINSSVEKSWRGPGRHVVEAGWVRFGSLEKKDQTFEKC
jgi:hypothetical protein